MAKKTYSIGLGSFASQGFLQHLFWGPSCKCATSGVCMPILLWGRSVL